MKTIDDILQEIEEEQLAKAMQKTKHAEPDEDDGEDDPEVFDDKDEDDEDKLTKSFNVTLSDGTEAEAIDGTALIKSLTAQVNSQKDELAHLHTDLTKALDGVMALVKAQGVEITELNNELQALRKVGKGAQSIMMAKAEPAPSKDSLMTKAFAAKKAGAINSTELGILDASLRHGAAIDPALLNKIQSI